jgi:uncharacterized protein (DUF1499 family)
MSDEVDATKIETAEPAAETIENTAPPADTMTAAKSGRDWRGGLVALLAIGSAIAGLIGPIGSGLGLWAFPMGLTILFYSFFGALAALLLGLLFGFLGRKNPVRAPRFLRWAGMAIALAYGGWLLNYAMVARSVPAIHDISTDLADPPVFKSLTIRADNLDTIPGADDAAMRGLNPQQRWVLLHQKAYGEIRSVRINQPVAAVIEKANRLAIARGWEVALVSPAEGRLEATETSRLFRFKDDVVLRVRPTENGQGSIVDMRSISRVGQSDIGVNAKRIKSFLADLSGTVSAAS